MKNKSNWLEKKAAEVTADFENKIKGLDKILSKSVVFRKGKKAGNSLSKLIDKIVDVIT